MYCIWTLRAGRAVRRWLGFVFFSVAPLPLFLPLMKARGMISLSERRERRRRAGGPAEERTASFFILGLFLRAAWEGSCGGGGSHGFLQSSPEVSLTSPCPPGCLLGTGRSPPEGAHLSELWRLSCLKPSWRPPLPGNLLCCRSCGGSQVGGTLISLCSSGQVEVLWWTGSGSDVLPWWHWLSFRVIRISKAGVCGSSFLTSVVCKLWLPGQTWPCGPSAVAPLLWPL